MIYDKPKRKVVRSMEMDQEFLLHEQKTKKICVLNPTASMIWSLCDGFHTIQQIATELKKKFKEPKEDILQDVCQTVEKLKNQGLLE